MNVPAALPAWHAHMNGAVAAPGAAVPVTARQSAMRLGGSIAALRLHQSSRQSDSRVSLDLHLNHELCC